jgi:proton-dependent oligopeptide transporter, POT family
MSTTESPAPAAAASLRGSRWYATLFTSDMFERFGFYGMQAILVLYAAAPAARGGLGLGVADASSLFGAWIAVMFLLSLPGGWVGDRLLGQRRTLVTGTAVTVLGYLLLAVPAAGWTAAGLVVLAVGGGLYKPNHQAMLNMMLGESVRRESGISLMYVGVQASALLSPLLIGYLGERVSWHLGFAAAAVAMLLNLVQLVANARGFGGVGERPIRPLAPAERHTAGRRTAAAVAVVAVVVVGLAVVGALTATTAIALSGLLSVVFPIVGYRLLYRDPGLGAADRRRLRGFVAVFLGATLFWMIIAHAASLLNLFAQNHVDREIYGWTVPASWMQAATPTFILLFAPVFAWLLPRIGRRHNVAVKFCVGLLLVGGSFLVMSVAAAASAGGARVSPLWLVVVYLAHACGELIIAAVSIAAAGDVLPRQFMARTLGLLWLFAALGGGLGAGVVRLAEVVPEPAYYLGVGSVAVLSGLAFAVFRRALTRALSRDGEAVPDAEAAGGPVAAPATT